MMDRHKTMMEMHEKMQSEMKAMDATLDRLLAEMNGATGDKKVEAIAAIINHLVQQHKTMHQRMPEKKPPDTSKYVLSPMPGLLSQLMVGAGDDVKPGQHLAVLEAMKMENVLGAERDGRIRRILAAVGDTLAVDRPILEFE